MRASASILHLDLDAFYAAVEQRDKPSLRGKAVIVGGASARGVVATASYEARAFGVHSAMSGMEARRRAPHAAFLAGRRAAYQQSSRVVMALLREVSPLVEPLSLDEAYVDLAASSWDLSRIEQHVEELRAELCRRTAGLTGSVGVGSSKFMAKLASEHAKPNGSFVVQPGTELDFIADLPVRSIPGVGPATDQRLSTIGIHTVRELRETKLSELIRELGQAAGTTLHDLAFGRDHRPVQAEREAKSISTEDTFAQDIHSVETLVQILRRDVAAVVTRLHKSGLFAKTVSIKVRFGDFTTVTRARSLPGATDQQDVIFRVAEELLRDVGVRQGVRLLGVGTSNFTIAAQEQLFFDTDWSTSASSVTAVEEVETAGVTSSSRNWLPGADVTHDEYGPGWVWGSGLGLVTVRFETRETPPGKIRTLRADDPALHPLLELPSLPGSSMSEVSD